MFGCGGNRDKSKRPVMGRIASENSDYVIVTSDNPRSEKPASIIKDILPGIINKNYSVEEDRKRAIEMAVNISTGSDVILGLPHALSRLLLIEARNNQVRILL